MKRLTLALVAVAALAIPATAGAKGPSEATITGPGLAAPLSIHGDGEGGWSTDLGLLVTEGGFFPQTFGQSPSPLLRAKPARLGPRYTVVYVIPPTDDTVRQDLYPHAAGGPVTYMEPGQAFWEQKTTGGWYRGRSTLRTMLVKAGLPRNVKAHAEGSARGLVIGIGTGAGLALAAGGLMLLRRRR